MILMDIGKMGLQRPSQLASSPCQLQRNICQFLCEWYLLLIRLSSCRIVGGLLKARVCRTKVIIMLGFNFLERASVLKQHVTLILGVFFLILLAGIPKIL